MMELAITAQIADSNSHTFLLCVLFAIVIFTGGFFCTALRKASITPSKTDGQFINIPNVGEEFDNDVSAPLIKNDMMKV